MSDELIVPAEAGTSFWLDERLRKIEARCGLGREVVLEVLRAAADAGDADSEGTGFLLTGPTGTGLEYRVYPVFEARCTEEGAEYMRFEVITDGTDTLK